MPIDTSLGEWREIGPRNYGGKAFDIAVDRANAGIVYAAYGEQGGLWKTTNGGGTWARVNDRWRNSSFASVVISPANANVIFAGLGAPGLPDADHGLLRSSDGGQTWVPIGPPDGASSGFCRIVIDRADANIIYTATENHLYKTTNGGSSWMAILAYTGSPNNYNDLPDLVSDPTDPNTLLLAQKSIGVRRTTDGGATWTSVDPAPANAAATVLAFAPSNPTIVYAERESGAAMQTYRSTNSGQTWTPGALVNAFHQGRYDEAIVVDPTDADHVFIANSLMFESKDGSSTFTRVAGEPHGDHLRLAYAPSDAKTIFSGNDGGVWRSTDGGVTWSRFDQGVETNISFGIDVDPVSGVIYMSPADYGCTRYTGNSDQWEAFHGGEWTDFFISPYNRITIFGGLGTIQRTTDGGGTWTNADPEPSGPRPYRYPFAYHPTDSQTVYTSTKKLYKSTDLGKTWTAISPPAFDTLYYYLDWFAVSAKNPSIIYALSGQGLGLWQTTDGGATWSQRNTTAASGKWTLAIVPSSPDQVYIGGYGGIQLCTNNGLACSDRSANLGSVQVRDIVIDPANESRIFLGTDEGVFVTQNAGSSWSRLGANFPPIRAWDLSLFSHHLYASSGQGVWEFSRTAAISPAIATYFGGATTVVPLARTTLSWNTYNGAASLSAIGNVPSFGALTVHPETSTTYTLTVGSGTNAARQSVGITVDQSLLMSMLPRDFASGSWKYEELLANGATIPLVYFAAASNPNGSSTSVGPNYFVSSGYGYVQYDIARNIIVMHPQAASDRQISAAFTAPAAGTYRFTGAFARFNDYPFNGDGSIISIIKNTDIAHPIFRTTISPNYPSDLSDVFDPRGLSPQWFDVRATLGVGEMVRFLVSAGPAGSNAFDATAFKVAVDSAPACSYSISPASSSIDAGGGSGTVSVATGSGCGWTASSDASWIAITSDSSGSGSGSVAYQVAANSTASQRQGTLEIAGSVVTITQTLLSSRRRSVRH